MMYVVAFWHSEKRYAHFICYGLRACLLFREMIKSCKMSVGQMFCVLEGFELNLFSVFFSQPKLLEVGKAASCSVKTMDAVSRLWLALWHNHLFPMLDYKWAKRYWYISTRQNWGNNLSSHILWVQNRTSKLTWGEFNFKNVLNFLIADQLGDYCTFRHCSYCNVRALMLQPSC